MNSSPVMVSRSSRYSASSSSLRRLSLMIFRAVSCAWRMISLTSWSIRAAVSALQVTCATTFVLLCGVSSNLSKSNFKRGLITAGVALGISVVTYIIHMPILFGVLHLLAVCMLLYALTEKLLVKLPALPGTLVCALLAVLSKLATERLAVDTHYLWLLGWTYDGFVSYDYFPLFPWLFVFLTGAFAGSLILSRPIPERVYALRCRWLEFIGRHALVIYVVHQPLLFGLFTLLDRVLH